MDFSKILAKSCIKQLEKQYKNHQWYVKYFGQFWGLYMSGITSIFDFKYSVLKLVLAIVLQTAITWFTNKISINSQNLGNMVPYVLLLLCLFQMSRELMEYTFSKLILIERLQISARITNYVNALYLSGSHTWKSKNSSKAQEDSLQDIFYAYDSMSGMITRIGQSIIMSIVILAIASYNDFVIGLVIIVGTIVLFQINKYLNTDLSRVNTTMGDKMKKADVISSKQFAIRSDILHTQMQKSMFQNNQYDPVNGFMNYCQLWDERNMLSQRSRVIITLIRHTIVFVLSYYLFYSEKLELIVFVIINKDNLFGFLEVKTQFSEVQEMNGGRLASSFKMIDELTDKIIHPYIQVHSVGSSIRLTKRTNITKITINNIDQQITDNIRMVHRGEIIIELDKKGIILLSGQKGCGKSMTIKFLAGCYDGSVTDGIFVNDNINLPNEFRDLEKYRSYVAQGIAKIYTSNRIGSLCMTLNDMFPNACLSDVCDFVSDFGIAHKIPNDMNTSISLSENGLSPGEIQSLVISSQLWKAIKSNTKLLLLDEPEQNIDLETVKKIFDKINRIFDGTIVLITHQPSLKEYLTNHIKEVWNYRSNDGTGLLTFDVQKEQPAYCSKKEKKNE
jgi:ABC-type multidrug transport system fused ATPase/permease subunit